MHHPTRTRPRMASVTPSDPTPTLARPVAARDAHIPIRILSRVRGLVRAGSVLCTLAGVALAVTAAAAPAAAAQPAQEPVAPALPLAGGRAPAPAAPTADSAAGAVELDRPAGPALAPGAPDLLGDHAAALPKAAEDTAALIARWLVANGAPARRVAPVAAAVHKYARLRAVDPLLVVGIIGVENAELVPRARSHAGARGVMQVMPHWKRDIRDCGGDDLHDVRVNVCFATRVLRIALDASTSVREALLRYNGCVRAPGCTRYASLVFSQAGRAILLSRVGAEPSAVATVAGREVGRRGTAGGA